MTKGILLDKDNNLRVVNGNLAIGESTMQDAYLVLASCQGEFKHDPIAGANLLRYMRGKQNNEKIMKNIKISLARVGIDYEDIKQEIQVLINNKEI